MLKIQHVVSAAFVLLLLGGYSFVAFAQPANEAKSSRFSAAMSVKAADIEVSGKLPRSLKAAKNLGISPEDYATTIRVLRKIGGIGGGPGYKCDSGTNLCTCDNTDALDCIDIMTECVPHPPGHPKQVCGPEDTKCECTWH